MQGFFTMVNAKTRRLIKPPALLITPQYAAKPPALPQGLVQGLTKHTAMIVSVEKPRHGYFIAAAADSSKFNYKSKKEKTL